MSAGREKPEVQLAQAMVSLCPLCIPQLFCLGLSWTPVSMETPISLYLCFLLPLGGSTQHAFP